MYHLAVFLKYYYNTYSIRFNQWFQLRGGTLDILGGGQKNFPCKNFSF